MPYNKNKPTQKEKSLLCRWPLFLVVARQVLLGKKAKGKSTKHFSPPPGSKYLTMNAVYITLPPRHFQKPMMSEMTKNLQVQRGRLISTHLHMAKRDKGKKQQRSLMELTLGPEPKFSAAISFGEEKELAPILSKIFQIILTTQAEAWYLRGCR